MKSGFNTAAPRITAWSYSRYKEYMTCPLRAKLKFIDKLQEPPSPAMARGDAIHKIAEKYVKTGGRFPSELKPLEKEFKEIRKAKASAEGELAFTRDWEPCGWFDMQRCWVRIKIDALLVPVEKKMEEEPVRVIDYKTGKIREGEYDEQLELYGLTGLLVAPKARTSTGELWFIDHAQVIPLEEAFKREQEAKLKKHWEIKTAKMLADDKFLPTPGDGCRWCPFGKNKPAPLGGRCPY